MPKPPGHNRPLPESYLWDGTVGTTCQLTCCWELAASSLTRPVGTACILRRRVRTKPVLRRVCPRTSEVTGLRDFCHLEDRRKLKNNARSFERSKEPVGFGHCRPPPRSSEARPPGPAAQQLLVQAPGPWLLTPGGRKIGRVGEGERGREFGTSGLLSLNCLPQSL